MTFYKRLTAKQLALFFLAVASALFWLWLLIDTRATYIVYLLIAMAYCVSVYGFLGEKTRRLGKGERLGLLILAVVYGLCVTLGNYHEISTIEAGGLVKALHGVLLMLFSMLIMGQVSRFAYVLFVNSVEREHPRRTAHLPYVFLIVFAVISLIDLFCLFVASYPGVITADSMWQIQQALDGVYDAANPLFNTLFMKIWIDLGLFLFNDINAACAVCSVAYILMMAAIFAFTVMTLYEAGLSYRLLTLVFACYALVPYHIVCSFTLGKDTCMAGMALLFIVSMWRRRNSIGNKALSQTLAAISALGFCLFRTNGFYAFAIYVLLEVFFVIIRKEHAKTLLFGCAVLAVSWFLLYPMNDLINVQQVGVTASQSIPMQQLARTLSDGVRLKPEEYAALDKFMDTDTAKKNYNPTCVDYAMKSINHFPEKAAYLGAHPLEFYKIWLQIGLQHPYEYLKAWVDQTKMYWNAKYDLDVLRLRASGPFDIGIKQTPLSYSLRVAEESAANELAGNGVASLPAAVGLANWIVFAVFGFHLMKKSKGYTTALPVLAVFFTLILSSPMPTEFRYTYSTFTCLPFLLGCIPCGTRPAKQEGHKALKVKA